MRRPIMLKYALLTLATLALPACAGVMTFDKHLRQVEGHPVNDVDLMLGQPHTGSYKDGDAVVYVWQEQSTQSIFGPAVTSAGGYQVGRAPSGGNPLIWSGIQYDSCVIRARTLDGIVRRITYEGNPGGCETIFGQKKRPLGASVRSAI